MAITTCVVSGTVRSNNGSGVAGVTVRASCDRPFIHTEDSSLVVNYENTTVTAADGTWSLTLIETTTILIPLTIAFSYPAGSSSNNQRYEYTALIPNTTTATFASIIGSQI